MKYRYPQRLLPKYGYHPIGVIDKSLYGKIFIARTTFDDKPARSIQHIKDMSVDMLPASHFRDTGMSMIMITNIRKKHLRWIVNYKGTCFGDYWESPEQILRPSQKYCSYYKKRGFFAFRLKDINEVYSIAKLKYKDANIGEHKVFFKVVHKPSKCNFFHCELIPYGEPTDPNKEQYCKPLNVISSKGTASRYGSALLDLLIDKIYLERDIVEHTIPRNLYRR